MDNRWNKVIYRIWAPIYDIFFNSGVFTAARKKVFQNIQLEPKQKILLIGIGTGADLPFIMGRDVEITGIDLSPDMLQKAKRKYGSPQISFLEMDAQELTFPQESFDLVIANLILSVVPDPDQCFREMIRVTRTGGRIVIFDKFVLPNQELTMTMKMLRPIIRMMGTDIGRQFENIIKPYSKSIVVAEDSPILFNGMYRAILLRKT
ncbi:class I SAM-dependent methyltransferase [Paenibacillus elgii]|uniref:class I SAM-dependent methyltransferase n=1 Tax=Paenibacillus elgii TaxID=189691 RepID=UPI000248D7C7|nr:class I SAM-dependent methyltransferase [Paenibacillus elgii]